MAQGLAIAIVLIAVAVSYWRPLRRVRTALGLTHLLATGHVFLVLGSLVGLLFFGDRDAMPMGDGLRPIVALVAGWVGFATGMRFDLRVLRTIPGCAYAAALIPAGLAALCVGAFVAILLLYLDTDPTRAFAAALVLAAVAASSGPTLVAMIRARRPGRSSETRPLLRMIEFSAGVGDIVVVVLAMLAFAMFRTAPEPVSPAFLIAAATSGGALLGAVTWLFLGGPATKDERLLLGLGMLVFIAGFASWLHLSPAAVAAIAAMVLVNLPGNRMAQLLDAVRRVERPAVVILMAVIGFHATGPLTWVFFPIVFALTILRLLCKRWGGAVAGKVKEAAGLSTSSKWGNGLIPQGTLGLMVALSFFHVWHDDLSRTVLGAVAVASVLNEISAPWLLFRLLKGVTKREPAPARAPQEPS